MKVILPFLITFAMTFFGTHNVGITFTECAGYEEGAYAEWTPIEGVEGYVAYVAAKGEEFIRIDNELIRYYDGYVRVDALGLSSGSYYIKVCGVTFDDENVATVVAQAMTPELLVTGYDRSGFAFSKDEGSLGKGSGAYNENGTLRQGAQVVYVTADTAKSCSAKVNGVEYTGFQTILDARRKYSDKDQRPIVFRIIGCIKPEDMDHLSNSKQGLELRGNKEFCPMNITFEGVGEDATLHGFGISIRNCGNVEVRNLGIMNHTEDGVSIYSKNRNIWVHDLDVMYGQSGDEADKVKGDGAIDVTQTSTFVTVSYVHFIDSGKTSLCGVDETEEFAVTYHHNWFDHSDSRHPLIRLGSVHMYNNYFDGNSNFGVGIGMGGSAFVEANYFSNCRYPMMVSKQGTDIADGKSGFEDPYGGSIKAYNNVVINPKSLIYVPVTDEVPTESNFDAVLVEERTIQIPERFVTNAGGYTYNNFDTSYDLGVLPENINNPQAVPDIVRSKAGRVNGGDFKWTFAEADNKNSAVDEGLRAAIENYESGVMSIGGVSKEPVRIIELKKSPIEAFVERMYMDVLGRGFDEAGKTNWIVQLETGACDGAAIAKEFVLSAEFKSRNLTDEQFVNVLYRTFFDREADETGRKLWLAELSSGKSREYVLSNFVNLQEFTMLCDAFKIERGVMLDNGTPVKTGTTRFVKRLYLTVLGRAPDNEGLYNHTLSLALNAKNAEEVAEDFFGSYEYQSQSKSNEAYVRDLYAVFLNRDADENGFRFWMDTLATGVSRDCVLSHFASSSEFKILTAGYGIY